MKRSGRSNYSFMGPRLPAVAVAAAILICACLFLTCGNC